MKVNIVLSLLICGSIISSCTTETKTGEDANNIEAVEITEDTKTSDYILQGKKIASATGEALIGKLTAAIQEQGFPYAIQFCSVEAIPLTDSLSKIHNVNIQRVTHKPRNPANAATEKELDIIRNYISQLNKGEEVKPKVELTESGTHIFYAPIVINNALYLNCHGTPGDEITEPTLTAINDKYPSDNATDFKMGDLRGMWKVAFE